MPFLFGKKNKKIQKLYQDYQKINDKIKISKKSISSVSIQQNPKPLTINIPNHTNDWSPCGSPPSPPKLIRQNATTQCECITSTANVETGGPYPLDVDDDVPESWEDL